MGKLFSLDTETKKVISDAFDDLLVNTSDGGLGKTCLLVYPVRYVDCDCVVDPIGNKSANRPRPGMPAPFSGSQPCPLCSGKGQKAVETSDEVTMGCNWEPRKFTVPIPSLEIKIPYSLVQTKFYQVDLPKVLKADYMILNLPFSPYLKQRFKLKGEPGDPSNIIQGRYAYAIWERKV